MTALLADYEANRKDGHIQVYLIKAANTIFKGAMACVDTGDGAGDGFLRPAANTAGHVLVGVALENSTLVAAESDGDREVRLFRNGIHKFVASAATQAWVGRMVFVIDDNTVGLRTQAGTDNGVIAGIVTEYISATSVRVDIQCAPCSQWTEESWSSSSCSSCSSSESFSSSSSS